MSRNRPASLPARVLPKAPPEALSSAPPCALSTSLPRALSESLPRALLAGSLVVAAPLLAGEADVVDGTVTALGDGRYRVDTTVRHADTGWDHYANRWDVLAPDGTVLGSRVLAHPHETEQPFTRSLTLEIPADIARVTLVASDSVHGTGGATLEVDVPR